MRVLRTRIQGFRCLNDVEIRLDDVTTFIGPNGVGKSSILRALDWFFNAAPLEADTSHAAVGNSPKVQVEVEFGFLSDEDRQALGSYAEGRDTVSLWKVHDAGTEKFFGNLRRYPDFSEIRSAESATEKRKAYDKLRTARPDLLLPVATSAAKVESSLVAWELDHPDELIDVEVSSTTSFFGFRGSNKLSGHFDYVFVSADLRASEESQDDRSALVGRLLEMAIDRSGVVKSLEMGVAQLNADNVQLVGDVIGGELSEVSDRLTELVGELAPGREVSVVPAELAIRVPKIQMQTRIRDGGVETQVGSQGHGFQRALLVSVLRMIAEKGVAPSASSGGLFLAIEEPELYQHPAQARQLGRTLRELTQGPDAHMQVAYATHSPMFVEPQSFHQLRRVGRDMDAAGIPSTYLSSGEIEDVVERLAGVAKRDTVFKQIDRFCPRELSEAVFADVVVLVEGPSDVAVFQELLDRRLDWPEPNTSVVDVGGSDNLGLCLAILESLNIVVFVVCDNDEGNGSAAKRNRKLLKLVDSPEVDHPPEGVYGGRLMFVAPDLEGSLSVGWPEWEKSRQALIESGDGFDGKNAPTYRAATIDAAATKPSHLDDLISDWIETLR